MNSVRNAEVAGLMVHWSAGFPLDTAFANAQQVNNVGVAPNLTVQNAWLSRRNFITRMRGLGVEVEKRVCPDGRAASASVCYLELTNPHCPYPAQHNEARAASA